MELNIGEQAVIDVDPGKIPLVAVIVISALGCGIDLEMLIFDRLRVVGDEGGAGKGCPSRGKQGEEKQTSQFVGSPI